MGAVWYVFKDGRVRADLPVLECVSLLVWLARYVRDRRTSYDFERGGERKIERQNEKKKERNSKNSSTESGVWRTIQRGYIMQPETHTQVSLLPAVAA